MEAVRVWGAARGGAGAKKRPPARGYGGPKS